MCPLVASIMDFIPLGPPLEPFMRTRILPTGNAISSYTTNRSDNSIWYLSIKYLMAIPLLLINVLGLTNTISVSLWSPNCMIHFALRSFFSIVIWFAKASIMGQEDVEEIPFNSEESKLIYKYANKMILIGNIHKDHAIE